jgi:hypothetical protein
MMIPLLWGATAMGCWTAGCFFLRFWRQTRDRLFIMFALAFWVLGFNWVALALVPPAHESRGYAYFVRVIAFVLLLAGIIDKNRKRN